MENDYVHGYSAREAFRLYDQAATLDTLLHCDTLYDKGSCILEAGCGTGAQTAILCRNNPESSFLSIDISGDSIQKAKKRIDTCGFSNVTFQQGDIYDLKFPDNHFDHVFVCFVLEHLSNPILALTGIKRVLKPGGTITVVEGDHGSALFFPDSACAKKAIGCLIDIQKCSGGDSLIGRSLYPLLTQAGFKNISVQPRMVYADGKNPQMVDGFVRKTFNPMIEGVKEDALRLNMITAQEWDSGIKDLYRTAEPDGVFCYTFFKGIAYK